MRRGGGTKRERERGRHREDKREGTGEIKSAGEKDRQTENHEHSIRKKKIRGRHYAKITDGIGIDKTSSNYTL